MAGTLVDTDNTVADSEQFSDDSWLFSVAQGDLEDTIPHRCICPKCRRPTSVCLCPCLPEQPLLTSTTVVVLQHPHEEKRSLATVPLLQACLPTDKCIVLKGRKFSSKRYPALKEVYESKNSVLVYPSADAEDLYSHAPWSKDPSQDQAARFIVALDGTWSQVKGLYAHNPELQGMRKVKLGENEGSEYVIRTQPTKDCLCTLESVAYALAHLEGQPSLHRLLTEPLKLMCQYQIDHGCCVHYSKDDERHVPTKKL